MGEKTILEQKVDTIMDWIKKQDDERCKKVVIGTFGRNSLRELIYDACDATGLSITEEESKKINRKLKEIIDKNLTETTEKIMKAIKEEDAETYKSICKGIMHYDKRLEEIKSAGKLLKYNFTEDDSIAIYGRTNVIIKKDSKEMAERFVKKIIRLGVEDENKEPSDTEDVIIKNNIEIIKKHNLIEQINKGTLDIKNYENKQCIKNILMQMEENWHCINIEWCFKFLKEIMIRRLRKTARRYIQKIKIQAENEPKEEKEKYLNLYEKICTGNISDEKLNECFNYISLNDEDDEPIREMIKIMKESNWIKRL